MLSEADSETSLRMNFRKVAELFGVEDMLLPAKSIIDSINTLPDAPPKYPYQPRMEGGIEKYLRDNWIDYIKASLLSRPDLKRIDKPAYTALNNYLRGGRELPSELNIPDRSAALEADIQRAGLADAREAMRLSAGLRRRKPAARTPK